MDRGAWWATVHGVTMSRTQLSDQTTTTTTHFISSLKILQARPVTLSRTRKPWDGLSKIQKPLSGRLRTRNQVCRTSNIQPRKDFSVNSLDAFTWDNSSMRQWNFLHVTWRKMNISPWRMPESPPKSSLPSPPPVPRENPEGSHSPKRELLQRWGKPSQVQMVGLEMKKAQSLSSEAPGLQRAQTEPGERGVKRPVGREQNPSGSEAWAEPWRGHLSWLSSPD